MERNLFSGTPLKRGSLLAFRAAVKGGSLLAFRIAVTTPYNGGERLKGGPDQERGVRREAPNNPLPELRANLFGLSPATPRPRRFHTVFRCGRPVLPCTGVRRHAAHRASLRSSRHRFAPFPTSLTDQPTLPCVGARHSVSRPCAGVRCMQLTLHRPESRWFAAPWQTPLDVYVHWASLSCYAQAQGSLP